MQLSQSDIARDKLKGELAKLERIIRIDADKILTGKAKERKEVVEYMLEQPDEEIEHLAFIYEQHSYNSDN